MLSRDVVLALGYMVIHHFADTVVVQPRITGKLATVLQMLVVVWVLLQVQSGYFLWLVGGAALFTALAWAHYMVDGLRQLEQSARVAAERR